MPQALEHADGSWAWVVLLASLVTQALTLAFPTCIGVFFTDLQRDFQASNSETSWFPSILTAMLHAGGFLLDTSNNFSYVFFMSSFFLISAALFMGGSFYTLQKKEWRGREAKAKGAISEATPVKDPTLEDKDDHKKHLCSEVMYVTSV
ncbi:monocarboxylate transporter 6 isoform X2 [Callospermophilus lateralis]|uniref:monocarboxylate transporter 6 isoform X2 n=1 Tax=Callospermophilus lateralis TaxID=76772 RepID=UPI004053F1E9